MTKKTNFVKKIKLTGIAFIIITAVSLSAVDTYFSLKGFSKTALKLQNEYIAKHKECIREQVLGISDMISHVRGQSMELSRQAVLSRVREAHSIASHIYETNKGIKTDLEIQEMIFEALRPVRFEDGKGYYFATRIDGLELLFSDRPEMEKKNLYDLKDSNGRFVIRDMIDIALKSGEGFYEYNWTKPEKEGNQFKKVSYIKLFKPYNFFIGTGLYPEDTEEKIKKNLLLMISKLRFGNEGYIFINKIDGDALVSNCKYFEEKKKLWEIFQDTEELKKIFRLEVEASEKPGGDYIEYNLEKLSDPGTASKKISFVFREPYFNWIVGTGFYMDEVEKDIERIKLSMLSYLKSRFYYSVGFSFLIVAVFIFWFRRANKKIERDFSLFSSMFKTAAESDEIIDSNAIQFKEIEEMAENANKILEAKKAAEKNLIDEKERLFVTIRSIGDGVISCNTSGLVENMNSQAEKLTGFAIFNAKGLKIEDIFKIYDEKGNQLENFASDVLLKGKTARNRKGVTLVSKTLKEYKISYTISPIMDFEKNITGIVLVFSDITEELKIKKELEKSRERFLKITENVNDIIFKMTIPDYRFEYISPSAEKFFGYSSKYFYDNPDVIEDLLHPDFKPGFEKERNRVRKGKVSPSYEYKIFDSSGNERWLFQKNIPVVDDRGNISAIEGIITDITEKKKAEQEIINIEKLKSVGILAGGIAHDFNNILMGLYGNISLARKTLEKGHPSEKFLDAAENSMDRASMLSNRLLTFSKGGSPVKEDINLKELVKEVVMFDLSGSNVAAVFDINDDTGNIRADKGQIQQVFSNLAINSVQAMQGGGKIYISMGNTYIGKNQILDLQEGKYVKVCVRDEGCGINKENLAKIFNPYFTTKEKGSGLGLAAVYSIIKNHHGHIEVSSEKGKGTKFTIYLPFSGNEEKKSKMEFEKNEKPLRKAKILIMDDEEVILNIAKEMLVLSGYEVDTSKDGDEALLKYREEFDKGIPFDLVVMDLTIPGGKGGIDTLKEILEINPGANAVVSSGYSGDEVMSNFKNYGFKGVVTKPYTMKKLFEEIEKVLGANKKS
ncbi:MAG: cache domain-containing protein [Desulfobacteraceae bacterium]|nr:cache domain-containing protein [Desulfobacteraceae bacterium]